LRGNSGLITRIVTHRLLEGENSAVNQLQSREREGSVKFSSTTRGLAWGGHGEEHGGPPRKVVVTDIRKRKSKKHLQLVGRYWDVRNKLHIDALQRIWGGPRLSKKRPILLKREKKALAYARASRGHEEGIMAIVLIEIPCLLVLDALGGETFLGSLLKLGR